MTTGTPPWQIWIGAFRQDQLLNLALQPSPVVLFGNQGDPGLDLSSLSSQAGPGGLWISKALLAATDGESDWHSYNDPRQNGPLSPEQLQPDWPNLRLMERRPVSHQRFDGLIERWIASDRSLDEVLAAEGGRLWLATLHPEPVLAGLGAWLSRFAEILWSPPGSLELARQRRERHWGEALRQGLLEATPELVEAPDGSSQALCWRQDPWRMLEARSRAQRLRIAALESELTQQQHDRQQLVTRHRDLQLQLEQQRDQTQRLQHLNDSQRLELQDEQDRRRRLGEDLARVMTLLAAGSAAGAVDLVPDAGPGGGTGGLEGSAVPPGTASLQEGPA